MFYSYVMGKDNSINELQNQGFLIGNDGDNYMVSFYFICKMGLSDTRFTIL